MNIKKLSALLVLISVFMFAAAMPAFAKASPPKVHPPQCTTTQEGDRFVVKCADVGRDIIGASIVKYNYLPKYTVERDGDTAVIEVFIDNFSKRLIFTWAVTDEQGNETIGFYPDPKSDG